MTRRNDEKAEDGIQPRPKRAMMKVFMCCGKRNGAPWPNWGRQTERKGQPGQVVERVCRHLYISVH